MARSTKTTAPAKATPPVKLARGAPKPTTPPPAALRKAAPEAAPARVPPPNRAMKAALRRIDELEAELAELRQATTPAPPGRATRRTKTSGAAPKGVAVAGPEPLDAEATAARDAAEENLSEE